MATETKRAYTGKDVDMLSACAVLIGMAINYQAFLVTKRSTWTLPFLSAIKTRIDNAFSTYLGVDSAAQMRQATQILLLIQNKALTYLAEFKVQLMEDFKNNKPRRTEILTLLGFTQHLKDAQQKDQEALIELLYKFKQNMNAVLQAEIITAGMELMTITSIIGYADALKNANVTQESFKGNRKVISAAGITEFNEIYNTVISIAKISSNFYKGDPAKKSEFSYAKTIKALNHISPAPPPTPPV